ncbi:maleylacetate reductase [Leucobacter weissii]|uniref:Maleylacetate reductase n=1 Tax=Leucobacter weissii TaxID=1983706 RepID=A0A939S880_9MICO|nr:maleylacetate reductase [Leucobacter weissii]MBO1901766.1 maleylacetate reductase [Leucobacter weissii]
MIEFSYEALPMRVRFGAEAAQAVGDEIRHLGLSRVLMLSTPFQAELARNLSRQLGGLSAGVFSEAEMHVPVEVAAKARAAAGELGADACVAVGGGSTIGLGKAIALEYGLPIIAVPTTFAGSEMTPIWGITEGGEKKTGRDRRVLPTSVVYDPELTRTLPTGMCVVSGFNAIAHAVEGLYAPDRSPIISLMAAEGVRALSRSLPAIVAEPGAVAPRADALRGSWLCGAVLGATTMSLHHKLCHVLGGRLNLPHAETHTVVLPHVLAFNQPVAGDARRSLEEALGVDDPARELQRLARELGAPGSLAELGMRETDVAAVVEQVLAQPYANPRPVDAAAASAIVRNAFSGAEV